MARHHPDNNLLLEYAAGTLDWGLSLAVSAHLHMCNQCRQQVLHLNHIGGALLEMAPAELPSRETFRRLMGKIEQFQAGDDDNPAPGFRPAKNIGARIAKIDRNISDDAAFGNLPKVLRKLLQDPGLKWEKFSKYVRIARPATGQNGFEVFFYRIARGGSMPQHSHSGLEVTLVLNGCFSDVDGIYAPGDFLIREGDEDHAPTATEDQECLCLCIEAAPIVFSGLRGWLNRPLSYFRESSFS